MNQVNLDDLFPVVPYDDAYSFKPKEWLVEGLWFKEGINGVFGQEKAGKSRLTCFMLTGALMGIPVLGCGTTDPGRVLYLAGEETVGTVIARTRRYARLLTGDVSASKLLSEKLYVIESSAMHLEQTNYRQWLEHLIKKWQIKLILIDPYRRVHGAEENSSTQLSGIHNDIRRWSNKDHWTFIVEHHTGRLDYEHKEEALQRMATWSRGSTDLAAILDAGGYVDRTNLGGLIEIHRQGRFPDLPNLKVIDLGAEPSGSHNPEHDLGFKVYAPLAKV